MTAGPAPREHAPSAPDSDDAIREAAEQRLRALAGPHARLRAGPVDRDQGPRGGPPPRPGRAAHRLGEIRGLLRRHGAAARTGRGTDGDRIAATRAHAQPDRGRPGSRHQRPDDQLGQHRGVGRGPRRDRGRHGRRAAGQPRAAEQPRIPRPHPAPAGRDRPACWSSTRRTASPTGGTTSGPTTAACARWSPGSRRTCRCSRPPRPPTPGSPATSRSNSAPAGAGPASHRPRWCCAARWTGTACAWPWCGCRPRRSGSPGWRTGSANCPAPASSTP